MSDFSTGRVDPVTGKIVYASDNDTLGIVIPKGVTSSQTSTVQAIGIIEGFNLGDGLGIYTTVQTTSRTISGFKSLVAGSGVVLTADDQTITINSNFTNVLAQLSFETLGSGASIFSQKIAGDVQLRSITGAGIVSVQQSNQQVTIGATAVTSVGLSGSADIVVANSPITSTGTIDVTLSDTGVQAGTYSSPSLTVDSKGRIRSITTVTPTPVTVQAGTGVTVSPGPNFTVGLTATTVAPGVYTAPSLIIDATGRITSASSNTIPAGVSASNLGTGSQVFSTVTGQALSFRSIAGSGAITVTQDANTITIAAPVSGTVTSVNATGTNGITITGGPISTSGTFTIGLLPTAVTAGTYTAPTLTVDGNGRITAASSNGLGEANTASNLSGGYGVFSAKVGADLQFRSIVAGAGITVSSTASTVVIAKAAKSCGLGIMATGSTQSDAILLTSDFNEITDANPDNSGGVRLGSTTGTEIFIANYSAHSINVYPAVNAAINALGTNTPYVMTAHTSLVARILSTTKVYI